MRFKKPILLPSIFTALFFAEVFVPCVGGFTSASQNSVEIRTISGRVEDSSGALLPRALIQVHSVQGEVVATTYTNNRGEFSLDLPEGKYIISTSFAGFASIHDRILEVSASNLPVNLRLEISSFGEQIVVTATKTETPLAQIGNSTSVVSDEELSSKGVFLVGDALRDLAGISIVQSGGTGQLTSLFLRGGESDYTKVLVDGIPMNEPGGTFNFANLSTSSIDRIELVRGPQSALFGSDAMTGVLQIFTRRGESEGLSPKPSIVIEGGTYATLRYGAALEGSNEKMDYFASFSRYDTDNNVDNGSFNSTSITGNLGLDLSGKSELRAIFRSEAGRAGSPGPWDLEVPDLNAYYRFRNIAGTLAFVQRPTGLWTQKLSYAVNDSQQISAGDSFQNLSQIRRHRIDYQSDLILPRGNLLTAGADYEHQSGFVGDPSVNPEDVTRNNFAGYIQDQLSLKNRFFTTVGVRLDHNGSFGFFASPRLSIALVARQSSVSSLPGMTKIKANFGLGIKEPSLLESYSTSIYYMGNPDLLPEKSNSFDVGIEQHFNSGRSIFELIYFQNHFRDQIGFAITDFETYAGSFFNIGKSRARGLETTLHQELPWDCEISGAYTFLDSEILEITNDFDPAFAKGQWLFRRPRHSGSIAFRWKPGRLTLELSTLLVGTRVDSDFLQLGSTRNKGYSVFNLLANYRLIGGMSIYAAVNNISDEYYMEALGYPALGRHFRIGLRAGL